MNKVELNNKRTIYITICILSAITGIVLFSLFIYTAYFIKLNGETSPILLISAIISFIIMSISLNKIIKINELIEKENIKSKINIIKIENEKYMVEMQNKVKENQAVEKTKYHIKAKTITDNEKYFLNIIKKHFGKDYDIRFQVPLSSIIEKDKEFEKEYQNELNRIIDIGIFDKNTSYPLLLIEINDSTHHRKDRKIRDAKVKNICDQAGIKLIAFWTEYSNTEEYIFNRVNSNIKDSN